MVSIAKTGTDLKGFGLWIYVNGSKQFGQNINTMFPYNGFFFFLGTSMVQCYHRPEGMMVWWGGGGFHNSIGTVTPGN